MHVFFDEQMFLIQDAGGISRYVCSLAEQMARCADVSVTVFGGLSRNIHLSRLARNGSLRKISLARRDHWRINTQVKRFSRLWRRFTFLSVRRCTPLVVYHPSYYAVDPFIARRANATVVTFHDMIPEWLHEQSPSKGSDLLPLQKNAALRLADAILTISEATRRDLEHFHPGTRGQATIIPLAARLGEIAPAPLPDFIPGSFFLFVGNRESYKNGMSLLRAMALLADRFTRTSVVFFGGRSFTGDENEWLQKHRLENRVRHVTGEDPLLVACYRKATALVYPSSYEGFGLPVLEAMQLGCPVITSPNSSLPEVAGEAAVYVDPRDTPALAGAMNRMLTDESWRDSLVKQGFARSALFSWSKTAAQTVNVYRTVMERKTTPVSAGAMFTEFRSDRAH